MKQHRRESNSLYERLEHHYRQFDRSLLEPDPLQYVYTYAERRDKELAAMLSAFFAYGRIKAILAFLEKLLKPFGEKPSSGLLTMTYKELQEITAGLQYRWHKPDDILALLLMLRQYYEKYESLEDLFLENYHAKDDSIKPALQKFGEAMRNTAVSLRGKSTNGTLRFFPLPEKKSACKRWNLFLRWMVRDDDIDTGLWQRVSSAHLIIPVDIHIQKIAIRLGLTRRSAADWAMAEEITGRLRAFDPDDPVKYDFALCHIGARKEGFWQEESK